MISIDIDMPENCHDCPCYDYEYDECQITKKFTTLDNINFRLEDCPLKEVPKDNKGRSYYDGQLESAIERMQEYIDDMDRELAGIKICKASEKRRAYFQGMRLGFVIAQKDLIEIQIDYEKELNHGRK